jgi:hypothetical protein
MISGKSIFLSNAGRTNDFVVVLIKWWGMDKRRTSISFTVDDTPLPLSASGYNATPLFPAYERHTIKLWEVECWEGDLFCPA